MSHDAIIALALDRDLIAGALCIGTCALAGLGLLFAVLLATKSPVHPFVPAELSPAPADGERILDYGRDLPDPARLPQYLRNSEADAQASGLLFGGTFAGIETSRAHVLATVWTSPSRDLLALCVAGRAWSFPYARTAIYSPLADGRLLVTVTQRDGRDISGVRVEDVLINARLSELLGHHRHRMAEEGLDVRPFAAQSPHEALATVHERIVNALVARGHARFVDVTGHAQGMWWSYTARGALRSMAESFRTWDGLRQFRRTFLRPPAGNPELRLSDQAALVRWTEPQDSVRAVVRAAVRNWFGMVARINVLTVVIIAAAQYFVGPQLPEFPWHYVYLFACGYVLLLYTPATYMQIRARRAPKAPPPEAWLTADGIVRGGREIGWDRVRGYRVEPLRFAPHRRQIVVRHAGQTILLLPDAPTDEAVLTCFRERLGPPG